MSLGRRWARWRMERVVLGQAGRRARRWLDRRLATDPVLRRDYERACVGMRALEARVDDWSGAEASLVEARLFDELGLGEAEYNPEPARGLTWALGGAVALAAAVALLVIAPRPEPLAPEVELLDGYVGARGNAHDGAVLALEALCGPPMRPADQGCAPDARLTFAYRLTQPALAGGQLVLFGVDEAGRTLYYQPTPVDLAPLAVDADRWRATGFSVRLGVNHRPGRVRIYALAAGPEASIDPARVEAWARALAADANLPTGTDRRTPWHERIGDALGLDCEPETCASAETVATIEE